MALAKWQVLLHGGLCCAPEYVWDEFGTSPSEQARGAPYSRLFAYRLLYSFRGGASSWPRPRSVIDGRSKCRRFSSHPALTPKASSVSGSRACCCSESIPGDFHQAVASGLLRTADHSAMSGAKITPTEDHWSFRRAELVLNVPVAFAATLAFLTSRGLSALQDATFSSDTDIQTRGSLCRDWTILALLRAFDGKRSLNELFAFDQTRKNAYLQLPARLVSIAGRDEGGNIITEDFNLESEEPPPALVSEAKNAEEVQCWRDGSGSPFLCLEERMGADFVCLVRAGDQYIWLLVEIDGLRGSLSKKSGSSLPKQKSSSGSAADIRSILAPSNRGKVVTQEVQRFPIVRLRVTSPNSPDASSAPASPKGSKTRSCIFATLDGPAAEGFFEGMIHSLKRLFEKRILEKSFK